MMSSRLFISTFLLCGFSAQAITSPSVSANALFLYRNSNFHKEDTNAANLDTSPNGIDVQETELQFYTDVDPYTRLSLLFSIKPTYTSDGTTVSQSWGIEPEEAFAESNFISNVTLKVGKFKAAMGKHNLLHSHAYPLQEAPLANTKLLGDEGLSDSGLSAAVLLPTNWFNEMSFQILRGKGENTEFKSPTPGSNVGLFHWKNLFDLSDELTLEAGASFAQGANSYRKSTSLTGGDLTFKWRPTSGGKYRSVMWSTEYLGRTQGQPGVSDETASGIASWVQYQFAERWSGLYRFDNLNVKNTFDSTNLPNDTYERHSLGIVFSPSEFSIFRLEYDQKRGGPSNISGESTEKSVFLQANFTIGAHPSHSY